MTKDPKLLEMAAILRESRKNFRSVTSEEAYAQQARSLAGITRPAKDEIVAPPMQVKNVNTLIDEAMSTHRGRVKLAMSMHSPLRCGGLHWEDGQLVTASGAKWDDIVAAHEKKCSEEYAEFLKLTDEEIDAKYPEHK